METTSSLKGFKTLSSIQQSIYLNARDKKDYATVDDLYRLYQDHIKNIKKLFEKQNIIFDNDEYKKVLENELDLYDFIENILSNETNKKKFKITYDEFVNETFPIFKIVYSKPKSPSQKGIYFNILRLHLNDYNKRLIVLLTNLETLWSIQNKDEREQKNNKDIMPNLAFDVKQPNIKGKKSIEVMKFIENTFKLAFKWFYEFIMKDYFTTLKLGSKKNPIYTLPDELLFKTYQLNKKKDDPTNIEEINYFGTKFIGDYIKNNLQTLTIDIDTNKPVIFNEDEEVHFHNIKNAIPKKSNVCIYLDLTSAYLVSNNSKIYLSNKMFQIYVKRNLTDIDSNKGDIEAFNDIRKEMGFEPLAPKIINLIDNDSKTENNDSTNVNPDNDFYDDTEI
jgi:hypothetical protein